MENHLISNEQLVTQFYSAFQKLDYHSMQKCYADEAVFQDPVFGMLNSEEVKAMWKMLCQQAKDFSLNFSEVKVIDPEYVSCRWVASYTFSATGRKVVNDIQAHLKIQNGKIVEHTDYFHFWKWSRQALGISGWLFGWTDFFRTKVSSRAKKSLLKFMAQKS